ERALRLGRLAALADVVTRGLDRPDELLARDAARLERDRGRLGGVVHGRVDALEAVQLPLDPRGARRAGHALDRELDALDRCRHMAMIPAGGIERNRKRPGSARLATDRARAGG